ncbi:MAG: hypothetical protein AB7S74_01935 [Hyphomicrobium sp.]
MGILNMWREARGTVLRKEYQDAVARMRKANEAARSAFFNNIDQSAGPANTCYASASKKERKSILRGARKQAEAMWTRGDWPSALGASICWMNAESRFLPGDDAAYVRRETDLLIKRAADYFQEESRSPEAQTIQRDEINAALKAKGVDGLMPYFTGEYFLEVANKITSGEEKAPVETKGSGSGELPEAALKAKGMGDFVMDFTYEHLVDVVNNSGSYEKEPVATGEKDPSVKPNQSS